MTWRPPKRTCVECDCPLILLRGERRQHCARCGAGVRAPKATAPCVTEGCAGLVDPSRSSSGLCVVCRARRPTAPSVRATGERRTDCASCGAVLGKTNRAGYCGECVGRSNACVVDGCTNRVAAFSKSQLCREHNRGEVRRYYEKRRPS